ncbi:MAG TPA: hypothetical protein VMX35_11905 [Acidobacteriota bacterium]|nr:hypothetical protein [Acidobacteriota bacterium]
MTKYFTLLALALALVMAPADALAEDENYELNWFLLVNYAGRIGDLSTGFGDGSDYVLGEERLRLDLSAWADSIEAEARLRLDFYHDALTGEFDIDLREAYIDYTANAFDFRVGRQVITWGVGDLIFINDVWPKDWVSFFTGRPLGYLKLGIDGARIRYSGDALSAEFVYVPTFEPDNLPGADRFSYFDPFVNVPNRIEQKPERTFENSELAVRIYGNLADFDVSGYLYKGFWHSPGVTLNNPFMPTTATMFYPELNVYGASAQGAAVGGILSLEAGYYDSPEDREGLDPTIPNSQFRWLVGYSRQLMEDFTLGVQYYQERIVDHGAYLSTLPPGFPAARDYRDVVTISLDRWLSRQTWRIFFFAYFSPNDNDYYLLPSITHKFSDKLALTAGANIFGGEEDYTFFGQFDENDNVYLSLRFDF